MPPCCGGSAASLARQAGRRPGTSGWPPTCTSGWPPTCCRAVSVAPRCHALDLLGELGPSPGAHVDHRPARVGGVPDGDQCLAGPDFDAVAVGTTVGGFPPVYLGHVTYCDRLITFREQPAARHTQSVTNSLQSAHSTWRCGQGWTGRTGFGGPGRDPDRAQHGEPEELHIVPACGTLSRSPTLKHSCERGHAGGAK